VVLRTSSSGSLEQYNNNILNRRGVSVSVRYRSASPKKDKDSGFAVGVLSFVGLLCYAVLYCPGGTKGETMEGIGRRPVTDVLV
jgi:hypothetical protein